MSDIANGDRQHEIREDVIVAYHEVMNKLKTMKSDKVQEIQQETQQEARQEIQEEIHESYDKHIHENIIELASQETGDELVKNLVELKIFISEYLDEIKSKLSKKCEKINEREAETFAREQEFIILKEKTDTFPEQLRLAVQKAEKTALDQLKRKLEYDYHVARIDWENEKKLYLQKIELLEEKVEQLKALKEYYNYGSKTEN